jgi:hypothetical protein
VSFQVTENIAKQREHVAWHEAGHAVAHVRFGIDQQSVTIRAVPEQSLGHALAAGEEGVWDKESAPAMVIAYCAGFAALRAKGLPEEVADLGASNDYEHAQQLIQFWGLEGAIVDWKAHALKVMQETRNIAAVSMVAEELLKRETIDDELVRVLVEVSDGETTPEEYAAYLAVRQLD